MFDVLYGVFPGEEEGDYGGHGQDGPEGGVVKGSGEEGFRYGLEGC